MDRQSKRRMKVARVMDNANPNYVSLVDHAANQTPFHALKMVSLNESEKDNAMKGKNGSKVAKSAAQGVEVAKITFPITNFADEAAVTAYLADMGFAATVTTEGGMFVAKDAKADDYTDVQTIAGDKGETYYVGMPPAGEAATKTAVVPPAADPATPVIGAATTQETVAKYDTWIAGYSEGTTITDVMAMGADGLPPAIYELNDAMYTALRNNLLAGDYAGARAVIAEFGDLIVALVTLFEGATVPSELVHRMVTAPEAEAAPAVVADATPAAVEPPAETIVVEPAPVVEPAATEPVTIEEPAEKQAGVVTKADLIDFGKSLGASLVSGIATALGSMQTAIITEVGQKQEAALTEVREEVSKTAERVTGIESRAQSRKSVDDETNHTKSEQRQERKTAGDDPLTGNLLGFRRRPTN